MSTHGKTAALGAIFIGSRQVFLQVGGALTGIVLARTLAPAEFGFYAIVNFLYFFFQIFGDLGLGAALIRQRETPATEDYRRVFAVRQAIDLAVFLLVFVVSPDLSRWYGLNDALPFRLLACASFLASFSLIPTIQLERHMEFGKLAFIEISQSLILYLLLITLSLAGWSGRGFALSWLAYSVTGALLANILSRWPIGWSFSARWFRSHLAFALPYQGTGMTTLLRDAFTPIFIGIALGTEAAGYANWAQMLALFTVLALPVLQRVYFPAFSRLQQQAGELRRLTVQLLTLTNAAAAGPACAILAFAWPITTVIFGAKWLTALPLFYALWIANIFAPSIIVFLSYLNAAGRSRTVLLLTLASAAGLWVLGALSISAAGYLGYGAALSLVYAGTFFSVRTAIPLPIATILRAGARSWLAAAAFTVAALLFQSCAPIDSLLQLAVGGVAFLVAYGIAVLVLHPEFREHFWRAVSAKA